MKNLVRLITVLILTVLVATSVYSKGLKKSLFGTKYIDDNGNMVTGWCEIKNEEGESNWYYFDPKNGKMVTNKLVDDCWIGNDGIWDIYSDSKGERIQIASDEVKKLVNYVKTDVTETLKSNENSIYAFPTKIDEMIKAMLFLDNKCADKCEVHLKFGKVYETYTTSKQTQKSYVGLKSKLESIGMKSWLAEAIGISIWNFYQGYYKQGLYGEFEKQVNNSLEQWDSYYTWSDLRTIKKAALDYLLKDEKVVNTKATSCNLIIENNSYIALFAVDTEYLNYNDEDLKKFLNSLPTAKIESKSDVVMFCKNIPNSYEIANDYIRQINFDVEDSYTLADVS